MRIERLFRRFRDFRHILSRFETLDVVFASCSSLSHEALRLCEHASADPSLMIAAAIPVQV
jgi:hypothetical protein